MSRAIQRRTSSSGHVRRRTRSPRSPGPAPGSSRPGRRKSSPGPGTRSRRSPIAGPVQVRLDEARRDDLHQRGARFDGSRRQLSLDHTVLWGGGLTCDAVQRLSYANLRLNLLGRSCIDSAGSTRPGCGWGGRAPRGRDCLATRAAGRPMRSRPLRVKPCRGELWPDWRFPGDDGSAGREVSAALAAYAAGSGSEHAVLTALDSVPAAGARGGAAGAPWSSPGPGGLRREKSSEMALPHA